MYNLNPARNSIRLMYLSPTRLFGLFLSPNHIYSFWVGFGPAHGSLSPWPIYSIVVSELQNIYIKRFYFESKHSLERDMEFLEIWRRHMMMPIQLYSIVRWWNIGIWKTVAKTNNRDQVLKVEVFEICI